MNVPRSDPRKSAVEDVVPGEQGSVEDEPVDSPPSARVDDGLPASRHGVGRPAGHGASPGDLFLEHADALGPVEQARHGRSAVLLGGARTRLGLHHPLLVVPQLADLGLPGAQGVEQPLPGRRGRCVAARGRGREPVHFHQVENPGLALEIQRHEEALQRRVRPRRVCRDGQAQEEGQNEAGRRSLRHRNDYTGAAGPLSLSLEISAAKGRDCGAGRPTGRGRARRRGRPPPRRLR